MKNTLVAFLILIFILPALGPWMPHDALQALHVQQEKHHGNSVDNHEHHGHDHDVRANVGHSVHFDVITYFNDYLHVDLKGADQTALSAPVHDVQAIDYFMVADIILPPFSPSQNNQSRGPPVYDWRMSHPGTPVYLDTQRLRI